MESLYSPEYGPGSNRSLHRLPSLLFCPQSSSHRESVAEQEDTSSGTGQLPRFHLRKPVKEGWANECPDLDRVSKWNLLCLQKKLAPQDAC